MQSPCLQKCPREQLEGGFPLPQRQVSFPGVSQGIAEGGYTSTSMALSVRVRTCACILVILLLGGGGYGIWYLVDGQYPLAGDRSHDFGEVSFAGTTISITHTFVMRNRTDEAIMIDTVRPSCGCTSVEWPEEPIPPGAVVEIPIVLNLSVAGRKRATVTMMIRDHVPVVLFVQAVGRKEWGISTDRPYLRLPAEGSVVFTLRLDRQSTSALPPDPTIEVPEGVEVLFEGWRLTTPGDPDRHTATKWRGILSAGMSGDGPAANQQVTLRVGDSAPLSLRIFLPVEDGPLEFEPARGEGGEVLPPPGT